MEPRDVHNSLCQVREAGGQSSWQLLISALHGAATLPSSSLRFASSPSPFPFLLTRLRSAEAASYNTSPFPAARLDSARLCLPLLCCAVPGCGMPRHPPSCFGMWLLLVLLQAAVLSAQLCDAPGDAAVAAVQALSRRLLGLASDPARDPDPSVYLALRLAGDHDLAAEQQYLARLQDTFQRRYNQTLEEALRPHGHPSRDTTASKNSLGAEWPETGRLALYLLGLRATCPPPDLESQRSLVTWLKYHLEEDWAGSRRHGHPLTSFYQYGLGVLALCAHRKRVREEVIRRLLEAEHHHKFRHTGGSAVDTEAVVVLAFTCLERERLVRSRLAAELRAARRRIRRRMVEEQRPDGFFSNVYSTPWAMQVFIASNMCRLQTVYGQAMAALLKNLDAFTITATMAQVLPVLHGRSYLDIASMRCQKEPDTLTAISPEPLPEMLGTMMVRLVVECPLPRCPQHQLYDQLVPAPAGASLLDVLRAAAAQEPHNFTFETQETPQGPFLTTVLGLQAQQQKRSYWQLLTDSSTSLQMGVAEYRPQDGDSIILRLSEW